MYFTLGTNPIRGVRNNKVIIMLNTKKKYVQILLQKRNQQKEVIMHKKKKEKGKNRLKLLIFTLHSGTEKRKRKILCIHCFGTP